MTNNQDFNYRGFKIQVRHCCPYNWEFEIRALDEQGYAFASFRKAVAEAMKRVDDHLRLQSLLEVNTG